MILPILTFPNKRLYAKSKPVEVFDETLAELLDSMNETMKDARGVGLAAIQVGVALTALIINIPDEEGEILDENLLEIINPKIIKKDDEIVWNEGCLSVPEFYDDVARYNRVTVEYQDRFGSTHQLEAEDMLAVAIQHEMDHLDGRLFIDRLSILKRKKFEKEWKKSQKEAS